MKHPQPTAPVDAPLGTVSINPIMRWFSISLHITSGDLDPKTITDLFKKDPTVSQRNGVAILHPDGTPKRTPKFGRWTLQIKSSDTDEWDIEEAVIGLIAPLPKEIEVWREVEKHGEIHLSLGLSMSESNGAFSFSQSFMAFLGERHIGVNFDVYDKEF